MPSATGHRVTVAGAEMSMPRACCRCNQPGTKQLKSTATVRGRRATRSIDLPYCDGCAARAKRVNRARLWLTSSVLGVAGAASALGFLVAFLPKAAMIGVALAFAIVATKVLAQRAGTTIDWPWGAWIVKARTGDTTFFCTNADWALTFAASNKVQAVAGSTGDAYYPVVIGAIVAAIAGTIVAFGVQPSIRVDNGGSQPLQIWIDGKKSMTVDPQVGTGRRPSVAVPYGTHVFGWSAVGASAPVGQTKPVKVELFGDHLLNPGSTSCYLVEVSVYGSTKNKGMADGPVELSDFYTFKTIDTWFDSNPNSISTHGGGGRRVSINTMGVCSDLTANACSVDARARFVSCAAAAYEKDDDKAAKAAYDDCVKIAMLSCAALKTQK